MQQKHTSGATSDSDASPLAPIVAPKRSCRGDARPAMALMSCPAWAFCASRVGGGDDGVGAAVPVSAWRPSSQSTCATSCASMATDAQPRMPVASAACTGCSALKVRPSSVDFA